MEVAIKSAFSLNRAVIISAINNVGDIATTQHGDINCDYALTNCTTVWNLYFIIFIENIRIFIKE